MTPRRKKSRKRLPAGRAGRSRRQSESARKQRARQRPQNRIEALLDRVYGRQNDYFDRRNRELAERTGTRGRRGFDQRSRQLDIRRNAELFDRLAILDFEYLMSLELVADYETRRLLLPQSVLGRAQNGHGWFADDYGTPLCFREATFDRVVTALEKHDPSLKGYLVRKQRSGMLQALCDYLLNNLEAGELSLEVEGKGLLGVEILRGRRVDTRMFLTGLVLAGHMDDFSQRQMTMSFHKTAFDGSPLRIGGGLQYIIRPDRLAACGIHDPGAVEFSDRDIRTLQQLDVIVTGSDGSADTQDESSYSFPEFDQAYFRRRMGEGVCDDLALIYIGARYGFDAMLGAFIMDAVDTYDKYLWTFSTRGFDTVLAEAVQKRWQDRFGSPLVDGGQIFDVIRFAAKQNFPNCPLSSSHRRFIQVERGAGVPTLLNHWQFVNREPVWDIELGFARLPGHDFYQIADARLQSVGLPARPADLCHCRRFTGKRKSADNTR